jgi:hypothetical protein
MEVGAETEVSEQLYYNECSGFTNNVGIVYNCLYRYAAYIG